MRSRWHPEEQHHHSGNGMQSRHHYYWHHRHAGRHVNADFMGLNNHCDILVLRSVGENRQRAGNRARILRHQYCNSSLSDCHSRDNLLKLRTQGREQLDLTAQLVRQIVPEDVPALTEAAGASEKEVQLSLQNLHRLGLLVDEFPGRDDSGPFYQPHAEFGTTSFGKLVTNPRTSFRPSPLGFDLLAACAS